MLNWMLSGICIVLLVLIVYHLSKAMQAFGILHGDLIGQQATEATAGSPIVTAPLSPQADPFYLMCNNPYLWKTPTKKGPTRLRIKVLLKRLHLNLLPVYRERVFIDLIAARSKNPLRKP